MAVIALTSAKGSPGVTTTVLALASAWPWVEAGRRVLVVDADVSGGDIAPGYLRGATAPGSGLVALAASRPAAIVDRLWDHLVSLDEAGTRLLLTGVTDPGQARSLAGLWPHIGQLLSELCGEDPGLDVLVDLGRLGAAGEAEALRTSADLVALVTRSSLRATTTARGAARRLSEERTASSSKGNVACVVVGEGRPYGAAEMSTAIGLPILTTMSWDPASAEVLSEGAPASWRFARSALMRSAGVAAKLLREAAHDEGRGPAPDAMITPRQDARVGVTS
ncbi:MAG: hypothetical protein LCI03_01070 [Actinobacteria bacterium]|nr:hypothetical protein [Actinomycetota bacterium]